MPTSDIRLLCENNWSRWTGDCSGFLKAVASDANISLTGQANEIIDQMGRPPWLQFGHDADRAVQFANQSYLVTAGLKASPNGHVVVIVSGTAKPYPTGYWGRLGGVGRKNSTINWAWKQSELKEVTYFGIKQ